MVDFILGLLGFIGGLIVQLIVMAIPTVWALYKKQDNAKAIMMTSIVVFVVGVVIELVLFAFSGLLGILGIIGWIWSVLTLAAWIYLLVMAILNKPVTILEKLGINL